MKTHKNYGPGKPDEYKNDLKDLTSDELDGETRDALERATQGGEMVWMMWAVKDEWDRRGKKNAFDNHVKAFKEIRP
jgi:hypothetical protein